MESTRSTLSGLTDADKLILKKLDDGSLFNICKVDRHFRRVCSDQSFWRERFLNKFGPHAAEYKPKDRSWKRHYIKVIRDINILNNGAVLENSGEWIRSYNWLFFQLASIMLGEEFPLVYSFPYEKYLTEISNVKNVDESIAKGVIFDTQLQRIKKWGTVPLNQADETTMNIYWMSRLSIPSETGDPTIKIRYTFPWISTTVLEYGLDYFKTKGEMWEYPEYFTPARVVEIIKDFYLSEATPEEIEKANFMLEEMEGERVEEDAKMSKLELSRLVSPNFGVSSEITGWISVWNPPPLPIDDPRFTVYVNFN